MATPGMRLATEAAGGVAPAAPFTWGAAGQKLSPGQVEALRAMAEARANRPVPTNLGEGLAALGDALVVNSSSARAGAAESAGKQVVMDAILNKNWDAVIADDWASAGQRAYAGSQIDRGFQLEDRSANWAHDESLANRSRQWALDDRNAEWGREDPLRNLQLESGQVELDRAKAGYRTLVTPEERAAVGIPANDPGIYQVGPTGQIEPVGGKGGVTINTGDNSSKFSNKADELAAGRMNDYVTGGNDAANFIGDLEALSSLSQKLETGKGAEVMAVLGPYGEALGLDVKGLPEAQAYQAITARMAPAMRVPGAGASSDFDAKQFLNSLASLGKTPEGNRIVIDTLRGIQDRKVAASDIAQKALSDEISWQEADRQIAALGDPYTAFNDYRKRTGVGTPAAGATTGGLKWSLEP